MKIDQSKIGERKYNVQYHHHAAAITGNENRHCAIHHYEYKHVKH